MLVMLIFHWIVRNDHWPPSNRYLQCLATKYQFTDAESSSKDLLGGFNNSYTYLPYLLDLDEIYCLNKHGRSKESFAQNARFCLLCFLSQLCSY